MRFVWLMYCVSNKLLLSTLWFGTIGFQIDFMAPVKVCSSVLSVLTIRITDSSFKSLGILCNSASVTVLLFSLNDVVTYARS